jgi:tetratricopeptide (TPR) repeat protein
MTLPTTWDQAARSLRAGQSLPPLPPLTRTVLDGLTAHARELEWRDPALACALMQAADLSAQHHPDTPPPVQAAAAWWHAWAAHAWRRPPAAHTPLQRATAWFNHHDDPAWHAACLWQQHTLPWVRTNYQESARHLAGAVAPLHTLHPDLAHACRTDHAYALMLFRAPAAAHEALAPTLAHPDPLQRARALLVAAAILRSENAYPAALERLEQCRTLFEDAAAPYGLALTALGRGITSLVAQKMESAEASLTEATTLARQLDVPMISAACDNMLAELANRRGAWGQAGRYLHSARTGFTALGMQNALADNAIDQAIREINLGQPRRALTWLAEAEATLRQAGAAESLAKTLIYAARCHLATGALQRALSLLEEAGRQHPPAAQQAEICRWQGYIWQQIGQPDRSAALLQQAIDLLATANQPQSYCQALLQLAALRVSLDQDDGAVLAQAAAVVAAHRLLLEGRTVQLRQGQALLRAGQKEAGVAMLRELLPRLRGEAWAECVLALARHTDDAAEARHLCERVIAEAAHLPAIRAEACLLRAEMAEKDGASEESFGWLTQGLEALLAMHHLFRVPELAGGFWQRAGRAVDAGVALACRHGRVEMAHRFVTASKAVTFLHQLALPGTPDQAASHRSSRLSSYHATLTDLANKLNQPEVPNADDLLAQFRATEKNYRDTLTDLRVRGRYEQGVWQPFSWQEICAALNQRGNDWIALDYHVVGKEIFCISADNSGERSLTILPMPSFALQAAADESREVSLLVAQQLNALIPTAVAERLHPETRLLIVPHGPLLHSVPWAGICDSSGVPLVARAVPVVLPSLQVIPLLARRPEQPRRRKGVLLAVEQFRNGYDPLPAIAQEATWLRQACKVTECPADATWTGVVAHVGEGMPCDFWHVATHAFTGETGWTSGFALSGEDVLLEQVREAAPLPPLVTFSACSGGYHLVLAGDEQIGLPLVCLTAGAQTVVSCLRTIEDQASAELMIRFYTRYFAGDDPALALALAQRSLHREGSPRDQWQFMICTGLP